MPKFDSYDRCFGFYRAPLRYVKEIRRLVLFPDRITFLYRLLCWISVCLVPPFSESSSILSFRRKPKSPSTRRSFPRKIFQVRNERRPGFENLLLFRIGYPIFFRNRNSSIGVFSVFLVGLNVFSVFVVFVVAYRVASRPEFD